MIAGRMGMFGGGIYFADSPEVARYKASHSYGEADPSGQHVLLDGPVIIKAEVDFGRPIVFNEPHRQMDARLLASMGGDSVKGRSSTTAGWEYVVFDASRIKLRSIWGEVPFIGPSAQTKSTSWLADIVVANGRSREEALWKMPDGYKVLERNLCEGSEPQGDSVYLAYLMTDDINHAITNVSMEHFMTHTELHGERAYDDRAGKRYQRVLCDLNSGTRRDFVCLSFTKTPFLGTPPVCAIDATMDDGHRPQLPRNWEYVCWRDSDDPADANWKAGGRCIWIRIHKE
jgi:hypothetical protein